MFPGVFSHRFFQARPSPDGRVRARATPRHRSPGVLHELKRQLCRGPGAASLASAVALVGRAADHLLQRQVTCVADVKPVRIPEKPWENQKKPWETMENHEKIMGKSISWNNKNGTIMENQGTKIMGKSHLKS